ncbi:cytochrome P450 2J4-like [Babylonia areolata]|uniref:cytochrome P450 2J4-like n=1 Tax=Babylonia areolata TaxID=304850 RepID=UPI003FD07F0E
MAFLSVSTALILVVAFLLYRFFNNIFFKKQDQHATKLPYPPGPKGWELFRGFFSSMDGSLTLRVESWARKYGEVIYVPHLQGSMVFLADPCIVREFYTGKATEKHTNDRMWSYVADKLCLRSCLAFTNPSDPNWPKMRKLMHSNVKFYGEGIDMFEALVTDALDKLVGELNSTLGQNIKMKDVVEDTITSLIAILLTGDPQPKGTPVWNAMRQFNEGVLRIADPAFSFAIKVCPLLDYIPGTYYYRSRKTIEKAKEVVYQTVFMDRKRTRTPGLPRGIVDNLLEYQSQEGADWMTDDHVMGNLMDVIAAGVNTSTQSISAILLYLIHYPEVMRRIQQEVDTYVGQDRKPSLSDRRACSYTEAFVLETLRLVSVVPLGFDHYVNDDVEIKGYRIPKGTVAFSAAYVFHRSEQLWDDPHSFKPERFLDEEGVLLPINHPTRQNLMPFSTGKRVCPGEGFARARIFLFVTNLMQHFDVLPPTNEKLMPLGPESWDFGLISTLKHYHCRFRKRHQN